MTTTNLDKGYAWLVLFACFIMRVLTEGFKSSLGILFVEWQTYFQASAGEVAIIGSVAIMVILITAPFSAALSNRLTYRKVGIAGAGITSVFILVTSFASRLWHIYITIALAGIGIGLCLQIACVFCVFYFDKRLGFANGICCSGAAVGTITLAPLLQLLIDTYGWRGATIIISALMANVIVCASLLKSSSSEKSEEKKDQTGDDESCGMMRGIFSDFHMALWRCNNGRFIFAVFNGIWIGMGYHTTVIYVVPYAVDVSITKTNASFLLSIFGISSIVGRLSHGWLIDRRIILPTQLNAICWLLCGIVSFCFPISKTYSVLATLLIVFGFCSGIGHSLVFIIMKNAVGTQKSSSGFAWFLLCSGLGALNGILFSGYLYDVTATYLPSFMISGTAFVCASTFTCCDYYLEIRHVKRKRQNIESNNMQPEGLGAEEMSMIK